MKNIPEYATRIKELRESREETQEQFAKRLAVRQTTVSGWEKGDEKRAPSAEIYFRLGMLAKKQSDAIWFWGLAGLGPKEIVSAANKIRKDRRTRASTEGLIQVPNLLGEEHGSSVAFPAALTDNPDSTYHFRANLHHASLVLAPGTVILDTKESGKKLKLFWDEIVLVKIPDYSDARRKYLSRSVTEGYLLGKVWNAFGPGSEEAVSMFATLAGVERPRQHEGIHIGKLSGPQELVLKSWRHEMETEDGVEIVGRVIAWFRAIGSLPEEPISTEFANMLMESYFNFSKQHAGFEARLGAEQEKFFDKLFKEHPGLEARLRAMSKEALGQLFKDYPGLKSYLARRS